MCKRALVVFVSGIFLMVHAQASQTRTPDAGVLLKAATTALGADNLKTVEFSGNGWDGCLGQAWSVNDGRWARGELRDYNRVIDFDAVASRHTAQQRAGMDANALGGCGASPGAMPRPQQSNISG